MFHGQVFVMFQVVSMAERVTMMVQFSWQRMTVISVYVNMVRSTVQTLRRVVKQVGISCF